MEISKHPQYVTREAIYKLVEKLDLPEPDEFSQDWEYEAANTSRIDEFLFFYENGQLERNEKFALMIVVISSFDDLLSEKGMEFTVWEQIKRILMSDSEIHMNTILYWSRVEEELEGSWEITSYMREVLNLVNPPSGLI
ncbi:hypothetical protein ACFFSY_10860 [Paenibacillus aurantiacus]|uniref:Uncharacterized protein n=1 Tax=Paenibacillus aurantiacus TaxID=1936118 RepID=A0ABV5KNC7_9BACL